MASERFVAMSLFDLDHTLLKSNISFSFGKYLFRKRYFSPLTLALLLLFYSLYKVGLVSLLQLHRRIFQILFQGRQFSAVDDFAHAFIADQGLEFVSPAVIARLRRAQREGHFVAILSSSPNFLVSIIAEELKVIHWLASDYSVDEGGSFSHVAAIVQGDDKAAYLSRTAEALGVAAEQITAYSDSILDLPLLRAAGHPVAVNPDRQLRSISHRLNWETM